MDPPIIGATPLGKEPPPIADARQPQEDANGPPGRPQPVQYPSLLRDEGPLRTEIVVPDRGRQILDQMPPPVGVARPFGQDQRHGPRHVARRELQQVAPGAIR